MKKSQVLETLEELPHEFTTEEFIDKLLFIEKVEKGLGDVKGNRTLSLDEAKERLNSKWSK